MLLSSRIGTSAYDLLHHLQLLPLVQAGDDAAALVNAAAGSSYSAACATVSGAVVVTSLASAADDSDSHCQLLLAREALACRPAHHLQQRLSCAKSSINEAYYNLDKVFA